MADMATRSEGFCTETLLIQPRLGDPESVEEVCKTRSLVVGVARVGRCPGQELSSEPASHEPQSARRRCGFFFFLFGAPESDHRRGCAKFLPRRSKTDSQSVGSRLNGTHLGHAKLHVAHSKDEKRD